MFTSVIFTIIKSKVMVVLIGENLATMKANFTMITDKDLVYASG